LFADITLPPQESGSLFWCHAVMRLQFTKFASPPAEAGCELLAFFA